MKLKKVGKTSFPMSLKNYATTYTNWPKFSHIWLERKPSKDLLSWVAMGPMKNLCFMTVRKKMVFCYKE